MKTKALLWRYLPKISLLKDLRMSYPGGSLEIVKELKSIIAVIKQLMQS